MFKRILLVTVAVMLLLPTMANAAGMNVRIQGDRLYWEPSDVSHSYYNVYSNGNLLSAAHVWNGTEYERYIGGLPSGAKIMVCAMVQTSQVDCETVTYNKDGTGGGDPDPDPTTYTVSTVMNGPILLWDVEPKAGAYQVSIKKDAQHKAYMALSGQVDVSPFGYGDYRVDALDIDGNILAQSNTITYSSSGGGDPVDGSVSLQLNGSILSWTIQTEKQVSRTRIYKDGVLIGDTTGNSIDLDDNSVWQLGAGTYKVVPIDTELNVIAESNEVLYHPSGEGGEDGGSCGGFSCEQLLELLACPAWDIYMGDIANAIRSALPPPPDWNNIASIFTNQIAPAVAQQILNITPQMADIFAERWGDEYIERTGYAPDVPSYSIPTTAPNVNNRVPDAENLQPENPYDQPLDFDLSDHQEIQIVDESRPFIFSDPLEVIGASAAGEKILPNDPNNSTNGIKIPDAVESEIPTPTILQPPTEPQDPAPIPSAPTPSEPTDPMPTPTTEPPPEEKKYYKDPPTGEEG